MLVHENTSIPEYYDELITSFPHMLNSESDTYSRCELSKSACISCLKKIDATNPFLSLKCKTEKQRQRKKKIWDVCSVGEQKIKMN